MTKSIQTWLIGAALAGLVTGASALSRCEQQATGTCAGTAGAKGTGTCAGSPGRADSGKKASKAKMEKHTCKGQNTCKGKGGCGATKGKNDCKGKGGCRTDGKPMDLS